MEDLQTICNPTWCAGCGNFGIWGAFKSASVKQGWDNSNTALVAGIGCHGHIVNFIKITSVEGLHGRAIPVATGIKLANHNLNVFVFTGDGDSLGEGGNHLVHASRRNHDITVILHDNAIYALTTGQTSPATRYGTKTKSTPQGNPDQPISPLTLAIASGATFVARGFAADIPGLTELIIQANEHKGLSVIDVLQSCPSMNKNNSPEFYRENIYYLGADHDVTSREAAFKKSLEWGEKQIPVGIFYKSDQPSFESRLPQLSEKALIDIPSDQRNLEELLKKFT